MIDFGADYRLGPAVFAQWYGQKHPTPTGWERWSMGCRSCSASGSRARTRGQPGLLSHLGHPGAGPLLKAGLIEPGHHPRLEERRLGCRAVAETHHALSRVQREHFRL